MLYYLGISIEEYGGDDGIRLKTRSVLPLLDLNDPLQFYYLVLALMLGSAYLVHRIVNSRFGMALRAARSNEARALAIGFSPYRYRLTAFVIAGSICGLAGALLVNQVNFLTPEYMHWTRSGDIMFMVILGGMGTSSGPLLGSFALLLLEDVLSNWHTPRWIGEHWQVILGPLLVLAVIFFRRGLAGLFEKRRE
jgi:branched-chain amino acid transport system permease protein